MKVAHQLSRLEPIVLNPIHGVDQDDWSLAPQGKWSLAQVVEHLAITVDVVAEGFEELESTKEVERKATPAQSVMRHTLLGRGKFPKGMRAPDITLPSDDPDPELASARFTMAIERTRALVENWSEDQQLGVFLNHPVLGDLNLPEWVRFHYVHCSLHARQIEKWLIWMRGERSE
jgi:hypothetical protein